MWDPPKYDALLPPKTGCVVFAEQMKAVWTAEGICAVDVGVQMTNTAESEARQTVVLSREDLDELAVVEIDRILFQNSYFLQLNGLGLTQTR